MDRRRCGRPAIRQTAQTSLPGRSRSEHREVANTYSGPGAPESSSPPRTSDGGQIAESLLDGIDAQRTVRKRPVRRRSAIWEAASGRAPEREPCCRRYASQAAPRPDGRGRDL